MPTPHQPAAIIIDRQRLWEVRRYCQVTPARGSNDICGSSVEEARLVRPSHDRDAALSGLLQILVDRCHVDFAMISLLDEKTQFFLAGAGRDDDDRSSKGVYPSNWFGCDQGAQHGGLCERTITLDDTCDPPIYEELDMTATQRTKDLPYVDGTVASVRHYAGAPLKTAAGIIIGTVFVMSFQPSSGLDPSQQQLLIDTADHVVRQLTLTLKALEGERLMRFQSATASLLQRQRPDSRQQTKKLARKQSGLDQHPDYILEVYQHAADVMRKSLELDGVLFQHVPSDGRRTPNADSGSWQDSTLATALKPGADQPFCLSRNELNEIMQLIPQGGVLHKLDGDWLMSSPEDGELALNPNVKDSLNKTFRETQQLLVMPLFDLLHNRIAAVCVGWLDDYSRVYSDRSDLPFMSAFCMTTMSEVLRLETQMLERVKSDFLGSISHEMKTPLHQTLGSLELLLQTGCSDEQCELAINARFGATQLLETIDKILQYSNISSQPIPESEDRAEGPPSANSKEPLQIIGPRTEHVAGAANNVDLIRMCEEVVEDTTKRMRLLETIMSQPEEEGPEMTRRGSTYPDQPGQQSHPTEKDPFTIVVFDASPIKSIQLPRNTGFRIVLENLLSNAIKFTRPGCCARVCLNFSSSVVEVIVSDCGYGMSEDFVRHNIYLPFAQQDPVASGMGLGLSLVKRNVDSLGGTVNIETDQASGTTATITVQTKALVHGADLGLASGSDLAGGIIPSLPKRSKDDLPVMHACFYAPSTWIHRYDKRDERSIDLVFDSLSSTLGEWYQPVLSLWQRQQKRSTPDLVFISQRNLAAFQKECGEEFKDVKKVVICAAVGKNSAQDKERIRQASAVADALIIGAVLPSKLWEVVTGYFPHILQPHASAEDQAHSDTVEEIQPEDLTSSDQGGANEEQENRLGIHPDKIRELQDEKKPPSPQAENVAEAADDKSSLVASKNVAGLEEELHIKPVQTTLETKDPASLPASTPDASKDAPKNSRTVPVMEASAQPHLLLVDDNNINLKMLGMFVNKCGIPAARSISVSGGQEAIDAFKASREDSSDDNPPHGFDIILMDLSMPEVSGFEATSSIRQLEQASDNVHRAYIVALTGLVSDKDRSAAYEAGVDDYVTKPAGLQKVRNIIATWQSTRR